MIIISDAVTLSSEEQADGIDGRNPRIGWHNLVTQSNAFADQSATDHPEGYLGIPATYLYWKGEDSDDQTIGVSLGTAATVNYIALARHNLGTIGATYVIESSSNGSNWTELTDERILPNDNSLIHEFEDTFASWFRVSLSGMFGVPEVGVMYVGQILRLQRRLYVGHTPLVYGRKSDVTNSFSEDGQFLGRVVRSRRYESSIALQNLTPSWFRNKLEPFFHESVQSPYFVAWRPSQYPTETGYVWNTSDPTVSNQRANGMMQAEWSFQGIR